MQNAQSLALRYQGHTQMAGRRASDSRLISAVKLTAVTSFHEGRCSVWTHLRPLGTATP